MNHNHKCNRVRSYSNSHDLILLKVKFWLDLFGFLYLFILVKLVWVNLRLGLWVEAQLVSELITEQLRYLHPTAEPTNTNRLLRVFSSSLKLTKYIPTRKRMAKIFLYHGDAKWFAENVASQVRRLSRSTSVLPI